MPHHNFISIGGGFSLEKNYFKGFICTPSEYQVNDDLGYGGYASYSPAECTTTDNAGATRPIPL